MLVTTKISLDLQRPYYPAVINAVQGDQNTRRLEISLYSGGAAWPIPEGTTVAMRYCKSDKTKGYYDTMPDGDSAWSIQGNVITVLLAPQMLTVAGTVFAQAEMIQGSSVLATFTMQINVEENPAAGVLVSEDYFNWLQWIEAELDAYLEKAKVNGEYVGGKMLGPINMDGNPISGLPTPTENDEAATKKYADTKLPITGGTMTGSINMNGQTISGLNAPTEKNQAANKGYVDGAVKKAAPRNLLDNSNFLHPINQRGKIIYTGAVYGIDRWTGTSRTQIELGTDGIVLSNTSPAAGWAYWQQIIPVEKIDPARDSEKYYTIVAKINGTVYVNSGTGAGFSADFGKLRVSFLYSEDIGAHAVRLRILQDDANVYEIEWIDLYEGEYTAETYPEHKPSGDELCTCLQYCRKINAGFMFRADIVSANTLQFIIPIGIAMRVVPSIESGDLSIVSLAGVAVDGFSITISMAGNGFVRFLAAKTAHGLSDAALRVESDVILSADL